MLFKATPIHLKMTLLMVAICSISLGMATYVFSVYQLELLEKTTISNSQSKIKVLAKSLEPAVVFEDERLAQQVMHILDDNQLIEFAALVLPNQQVMAAYQKDPQQPQPQVTRDTTLNLDSAYLDITEDIQVQGQKVAYVFLRTSLHQLHADRDYYRVLLLTVFLVSILLSLLLSFYTQRWVTRPLKSLVKHVDYIQRTQDYHKPLELKTEDEVGRLIAGFNHMMNTVQAREQELSSHGDRLQQLVDIRTEQLFHQAHHDELTGLPNRYLLIDRLEHAINSAERHKTPLALLFLDLDRFKIINDTLGHDVGDKLLKAVATRLKSVARASDTIARIGGDEFVILLEDISSPENCKTVAQKIIELLTAPFEVSSQPVHISTSVGISLYPNDGKQWQVLLKNADISMYHAKATGPGNFSFFNRKMNSRLHKRLLVENKLRKAIDNDEFSLVYQPQLHIPSNKIHSVEALIRWYNPELGQVAPNDFIPIAEEIGFIQELGNWVIARACKQLAHWKQSGIQDLVVAINVSASHLTSGNIIQQLREQVELHQIDYKQLELEITEEIFADTSKETISILQDIRELGVKIAIDDFGKGYSSLRYLQDFPNDTLKLDGMFLKELMQKDSSQAIVDSTITLARNLRLSSVVECVESKEQFEYLQARGCDYAQGYYLFKPSPAENITELLVSKQNQQFVPA